MQNGMGPGRVEWDGVHNYRRAECSAVQVRGMRTEEIYVGVVNSRFSSIPSAVHTGM